MSKAILVTGGLGYIGSHTVVALANQGYIPVIIDNLSNTTQEVLNRLQTITKQELPCYIGDVRNTQLLSSIFEKHKPQAVIHFAAFKAVGESVEQPLKYYNNNVIGLLNLLSVMQEQSCNKLVFSSSCTVYGQPEQLPVSESAPMVKPESPYGNTKKICEEILMDLSTIQSIALRYFNPIGAHASALIGELPLNVPNNLVPYITQTAAGLRTALTIHGNDYPTPDGTCIRDYIHVEDLADAHILALEFLVQNPKPFDVFNIGTGIGFSVNEVVQTFEKVNNLSLPYQYGPRRPGDVIQVWADPGKAMKQLGWKPKETLQSMLSSAWKWQCALSAGE